MFFKFCMSDYIYNYHNILLAALQYLSLFELDFSALILKKNR